MFSSVNSQMSLHLRSSSSMVAVCVSNHPCLPGSRILSVPKNIFVMADCFDLAGCFRLSAGSSVVFSGELEARMPPLKSSCVWEMHLVESNIIHCLLDLHRGHGVPCPLCCQYQYHFLTKQQYEDCNEYKHSRPQNRWYVHCIRTGDRRIPYNTV
jgi:hypothetical protein